MDNVSKMKYVKRIEEILRKFPKVSLSSSEVKKFQNGSFVKESEARISIYDSALMFGDMVFWNDKII